MGRRTFVDVDTHVRESRADLNRDIDALELLSEEIPHMNESGLLRAREELDGLLTRALDRHSAIKIQLETADIEEEETGEETDPEWRASAAVALRHAGRFNQRIQSQLGAARRRTNLLRDAKLATPEGQNNALEEIKVLVSGIVRSLGMTSNDIWGKKSE